MATVLFHAYMVIPSYIRQEYLHLAGLLEAWSLQPRRWNSYAEHGVLLLAQMQSKSKPQISHYVLILCLYFALNPTDDILLY